MSLVSRLLAIFAALGSIAGFSADSQTAVRTAIVSAAAAVIAIHAALEALMHHNTTKAGKEIALAKVDAQRAATAASSPALRTDVDDMAGIIGQAVALLSPAAQVPPPRPVPRPTPSEDA